MESGAMMEEFGGAVEKIINPAAAHFVLVHGIGGGAWCWYKMRCLMENSGYKVSCLDLKGGGIDPTDPNTILSFKDYNSPLIHFLSSLPPNHQVILVGHSAGGLSLTDAIRKFGKEKIKLAVFVAATMLKSGFITDQDLKDGAPDLFRYGEMNEVYDMGFGLGEAHPPTTVKDSCLAAMLVKPGPIEALLRAQFDGGDEKLDEVPRIYIKTTQDNVLKPEQQAAMIDKWPPADVYELDCDHSPLFSAPFLLFGLLVKATVSFQL